MTFTVEVASFNPWPDEDRMLVVAWIRMIPGTTIPVIGSGHTTMEALMAIFQHARAYCWVTAAARN